MIISNITLAIALGLIFAPLERLIPSHPHDWSRERLTTDTLHLLVGGSIIVLGNSFVALALGTLADQIMPSIVRNAVRQQPIWMQFFELLVISDLGFYVAHRLVHAVPFLWKFHEVHHSSDHLDWLATYRVHPVDQILNSTIIALPGVLLGFSPVAFIAFGLIYRVHAILLHSNLKLDFGILSWLIASPHYHHWHHANEPDAYDKNFGGQLLIFDRLFGTLRLPSSRPSEFGVPGCVPKSFLGQLMHPFRGHHASQTTKRNA